MRFIHAILTALLVSALTAASLPVPAATYAAASPPPPLVEILHKRAGKPVKIGYHTATGLVRFIGTDHDHPIPARIEPAPPQLAPQGKPNPESSARQFLGDYGALFGLKDQARELVTRRVKQADPRRSVVRFQQIRQGIPVLGGELAVQLNDRGEILSLSGELLPEAPLNLSPSITAEAARQAALSRVAKVHALPVEQLSASQPELWIYDPALVGGPGLARTALVWRMEVVPLTLLPIRELVLVDARTGKVALSFNQVDTVLYRQVYDNQNIRSDILPGTSGPVLTETSGDPSLVNQDARNAFAYTGATYHFYQTLFGRDSLDGAGMNIVTTVRFCSTHPAAPCPFPNAFWNGKQMVFGEGFASAADVVAHELTHAVTEYESRLFYYYQSGAINEALSDIFGELVELGSAGGADPAPQPWLIGEDLPGGSIRSMQDPTLHNDPDRMTSPYYTCDPNEKDYGGVHSNNGVANKAAYLMAAGDTFNGIQVTPIGTEKTARIWYEVQTNLLTSASDYQDLYNALPQACASLAGTHGITWDDCQQVQNAVTATEMNLQPTSCAALEAPLCPAGQQPLDLFFDDMENPGRGNWSRTLFTGSSAWYYPQNPNRYFEDMSYASSGSYLAWGDDVDKVSDSALVLNRSLRLLPGHVQYLHFKHAYGFDDGPAYYDGGVLEYSLDDGLTWLDAGPLFDHNGYNGWLGVGYGNPLTPSKSRLAFVGESNGYVSSRLNLTTLAGQNFRFRFRLGTDSYEGDFGWFIDDVRVYTCRQAVHQTSIPLVSNVDQSSSGWVTIESQNFEADFPAKWQVFDEYMGSLEYFWGKRSCRAYAGNYSAWVVGGGVSGEKLSCSSPNPNRYPNLTSSWLLYGPFSLTDAAAAQLNLKLWLNSEYGSDKMYVLASVNGDNFYGYSYTGTKNWEEITLDLANVYTLGSLLDKPQVWVALIFESDASENLPEGAYVDDILLRKCTGGTCAPPLLSAAFQGPQPQGEPAQKTLAP